MKQKTTRSTDSWLLLIPQLPPEPAYLRVKLSRRLQRLGAVALRSSVYVLPRGESTLEDFQWLVREIRNDGAQASLCEATFVDGRTDADIAEAFRTARAAEYRDIEEAARSALRQLKTGGGPRTLGEAERLRTALAELDKLDFGHAAARKAADKAVTTLLARAKKTQPAAGRTKRTAPRFVGRTWVTREGIKVDRIASAWLIRRFIDKKARLRFVDPRQHRHTDGELRFDMYEAEYTHEGDRCSFETLLARFQLTDRALEQIAEIVHDLDVKDGKFGRPEAAGVALMLDGVLRACNRDVDRLNRGAALFDDLYQSLS